MRLGPRYQVLALLGEGAMGQVYLAKHLDLGRKEAVKVLKPEVATDERFVARFRREARATNRLYHPNVVAMYDFGQLPDGRFYLAMEYVDGAPLSTLLADGERVSPPMAVNIACQLASAVEHAHSRGVLHRDLKPANLMIVRQKGRDDVLKVLDFGVAKIISPEYRESMLVSQEGIVFGTPLYMAPEQFVSHAYDPRSDVYAVGCIAFELFTGEPPFIGKISEVVTAHAEQAPPRVSDLVSDIPPELDRIILKCLAKNPLDRFQTAGDLLAELIHLHPRYGQVEGPDDSGLVPNLASYDIYDSVGKSGMLQSTIPRDRLLTEEGESEEEVAHRRDLERALLELAEALLDMGASDVRLTITVADARSLENDLRECDGQYRALSERMGRIGQAGKEREGMLRFAIGELRFDRDRGSADPSLDYQISELEKRLSEVMNENDAQRTALAEEGIELAVRRAEIEAGRAEAYERLELLVDEIAPQFADESVVTPALTRYTGLRGE